MEVGALFLCLVVAWQVVQITALDLGASINPFSGNKQFIVRVVHQLPSLDHVPSERVTKYRDEAGQDFSCILPASSAREMQEEKHKEANITDASLSVQQMLTKIAGDCVRQKEGWWIYEVCVGVHVRQYHTGESDGPLHAVQTYSKGKTCDLTGMERRVDVRFLCSDDSIHIKTIEEVVSCQYLVVVGTPAICSGALGTSRAGKEKVRLLEVLCKPDEFSRDSRTVLEQAIADSVAKARERGESHIPEPPNVQTPADTRSQGGDPGLQGSGEEEEMRIEL